MSAGGCPRHQREMPPPIFVSFRVPRRRNRPLWVGATHGEATKPSEASAELSCRGHLTQTAGRDDAAATGEGRPDREAMCGESEHKWRPSSHGGDAPSQAAAPRVRCAAFSWSRVSAAISQLTKPFHQRPPCADHGNMILFTSLDAKYAPVGWRAMESRGNRGDARERITPLSWESCI